VPGKRHHNKIKAATALAQHWHIGRHGKTDEVRELDVLVGLGAPFSPVSQVYHAGNPFLAGLCHLIPKGKSRRNTDDQG
jgi:hypothetical protein